LFRNILNIKLLQKSLFLNEKRVLQLGYRGLKEQIKINVSLQSVQQHGNDESPIHATPPGSKLVFLTFSIHMRLLRSRGCGQEFS